MGYDVPQSCETAAAYYTQAAETTVKEINGVETIQVL
jgi:hypothetical protein